MKNLFSFLSTSILGTSAMSTKRKKKGKTKSASAHLECDRLIGLTSGEQVLEFGLARNVFFWTYFKKAFKKIVLK